MVKNKSCGSNIFFMKGDKTMQILISNRAVGLFISLTFIFALNITTSEAQQKIKAAGKMTVAFTNQERIEVGDAENHIISLTEAEGINVSAGMSESMNGAQVVNLSFSDLVEGNGPQNGYVKFAMKGDTTIAKWEGKVTTTLSAGGSPIMKFAGTFSWIKGTGQFKNIQGSGTYKGEFTSKTEYTSDWEGEYSIRK
jgi:hypothetical protein